MSSDPVASVAGWEWSTEAPDFLKPAGRTSTLLIDGHESTGAARFSEAIFWGRSTAEDGFEILLGNLGVGLIIFRAHQSHSRDFERSLNGAATRLIRDFCDEVARSAIQKRYPRPESLLPPGRLLWWHRLLASHSVEGAHSAPEIDGEVSVVSGFEVLDGFSRVWIQPDVDMSSPGVRSAEDGAIRGLLIATEDWIIADTTNRLLTMHLRTMDEAIRSGDWHRITGLMEAGSELVRDAQYLKLYMDERNRYLAQARREVWRSARLAWGLDAEVSELDTRAATVHMQLQEAAQLVQARRDRSRNLILFAIGMFAAVQSLLVIYDFSVNDDVSVDQAIRLVAAVAVVLLGAGISLTVVSWKRRL